VAPRIEDATRYESVDVGERLASGRFATVHEATLSDAGERTVAAVKLPTDPDDPAAREHVRNEGVALERLRGVESVPTSYDHGTEPVPWVAMERADGTLSDVLDDLPSGGRLAVVRNVCEAVGAAHERDLYHGDVEPGNVLRVVRDGVPTFVLGDWGSASVDGSTPGDDASGFTLPFAAPERLRGRDPTRRSDVYGLGAIAHALFTHYPPFEYADEERLREAAVTDADTDEDLEPLLESYLLTDDDRTAK
jgi:serine/threonine protein kinase